MLRIFARRKKRVQPKSNNLRARSYLVVKQPNPGTFSPISRIIKGTPNARQNPAPASLRLMHPSRRRQIKPYPPGQFGNPAIGNPTGSEIRPRLNFREYKGRAEPGITCAVFLQRGACPRLPILLVDFSEIFLRGREPAALQRIKRPARCYRDIACAPHAVCRHADAPAEFLLLLRKNILERPTCQSELLDVGRQMARFLEYPKKSAKLIRRFVFWGFHS
jgi:hypothetical protein